MAVRRPEMDILSSLTVTLVLTPNPNPNPDRCFGVAS